MQVKLYHSTSRNAAQQIHTEGFAESDLFGVAKGVFLSDRPLDPGDGVALSAEVTFVLAVPYGFDLTEYEVIEEGRPADAYREWLIPAEHVNQWSRSLASESHQ